MLDLLKEKRNSDTKEMFMGRPKGSKNKTRTMEIIQPITGDIASDVPMVGVTVKEKERRKSLPVDPSLVLTKTIYGTMIAIEGICKLGNSYQFIVTPNYKERTSKTMVDSRDVLKPIFSTKEQEKEFEGIPFGVKIIEQPVAPETITQSPDTVTETPMTVTQSPETTTLEAVPLNDDAHK